MSAENKISIIHPAEILSQPRHNGSEANAIVLVRYFVSGKVYEMNV
jgi:hypothetical protein